MWVTQGARHLWKDGEGQVVASIVTVPSSGKAFAQVIRSDGKAIREEHTNIAMSREWCERMMGMPPPTAPPRASPDQVITKLVTVLLGDPNLAWDVVRQVHVLSPWTQEEGVWRRMTSAGTTQALVSPALPGYWKWCHQGTSADVLNSATGFSSDRAARDACDEYFKKNGWVLAG